MDHLVTKQVFTFDAEEHVTIAHRNRDHHRSCLAAAESIFIDDDFEPRIPVAQISRRVRGNKYVRFRFDRRQEPIAPGVDALTALPRDAIVTISLGCEVQLRFALAIGFHCLREYVVMLITAKLQAPRPLASAHEWRKHTGALLQFAQLRALSLHGHADRSRSPTSNHA